MKLRLLPDDVMLIPAPAIAVTDSGLVMPDTARKRAQEGRVIATGARVRDIRPGDRVFFGDWCGTDMTLTSGEELRLVKQQDILGIIATGVRVRAPFKDGVVVERNLPS